MARFLIVLMVLVTGGVVAYRLARRPESAGVRTVSPQPVASSESVSETAAPKPHRPSPRRQAPAESPAPVDPAAAAPEWIERLLKTDLSRSLTAEQVAEIKAGLAEVRAQGVAAIPSVQAFLARNQDVTFPGPAGRGPVGHDTLRTGLFDALRQIDGAEAREVLAGVLRDTGDPREVRLLARHLEEMAPGQYRDDILSAARETLDLAKRGQIAEGDLGPMFDLLRRHGDSTVVADLEALRSSWSHYASIALAGLPDGEGIPSLLAVAGSGESRKPPDYLFSFQLLAQAAARRQAADTGLVEMARDGRIPDQAWPLIMRGLVDADAYQYGRLINGGGSGASTSKVRGGEQPFHGFPLAAGQDGELIQARIGFIDRMLEVTSNPAGVEALRQARAKLSEKSGAR